MGCEVNKCCFCADLRTGSFIIGYIGLVWSAMVSIIYILAIVGAGIVQSPFAIAVMSILFGISLIRLFFLFLLVVGLHKYKPQLVKAFLVYGVIFIICGVILCILNIVNFVGILDIIINVLDLLLNIYFMIVIRSYYLKMIETEDQFQKPQMYA